MHGVAGRRVVTSWTFWLRTRTGGGAGLPGMNMWRFFFLPPRLNALQYGDIQHLYLLLAYLSVGWVPSCIAFSTLIYSLSGFSFSLS